MKSFDKTQNIIYLVVIAISLIAIIVLGSDFFRNKASDEATHEISIVDMKEKKNTVTVTVDTKTIQDGLADMGILITQEYYFTQVEKYTKEKKILNIVPSSSAIMYSYEGSVLAGIDFEKISLEKDENLKSITVKMPHAGIQATTIDKDSFEVYSEKESLWNQIKLEDFNNSLSEFEKAANQKAIDNGILERADEQAKILIENFIKNFPHASEYEITFIWED